MLIKYNKNTDRFDLIGLTISDLSAIGSALNLAGDYGKEHKKLSKVMGTALDEFEHDARSGIIRR